jgi:hypothetical protein
MTAGPSWLLPSGDRSAATTFQCESCGGVMTVAVDRLGCRTGHAHREMTVADEWGPDTPNLDVYRIA